MISLDPGTSEGSELYLLPQYSDAWRSVGIEACIAKLSVRWRRVVSLVLQPF